MTALREPPPKQPQPLSALSLKLIVTIIQSVRGVPYNMLSNRLFWLTEGILIQQLQSESCVTAWTAGIIPKLEALLNMAAVELAPDNM